MNAKTAAQRQAERKARELAAGPEHEFWGTDDEGNDWRVHVRIAEWRD